MMIRIYEPPWKAEEKLQRMLQRRQQRQEAKRDAAAAATDRLQAIKVNSSKRVCSDEKYGEVQLPPGVLQKVMSHLAVMEADGVRGPSMAARDLANTALVSWDFYNASKYGLATLEQQAAALSLTHNTFFEKPAGVQCTVKTLMQLPYLPAANGWSWQQWAAFLQDPLQYKVAELKQAARQLRVPGNSSKAVLVVSILQAFGLQEPSSVAPQLLRAVLLERCCAYPWTGCEVIGHAWDALQRLGPAEVDRKWPHLSETVFNGLRTTAAERRRALYKYAGASSKQQLLQIEHEVLQRQEEIQERERRHAETQHMLAIQCAIEAGEYGYSP